MFNESEQLVFDLDGVLARFVPQVRVAALAQAASVSAQHVARAIDQVFLLGCDSGAFSLVEMTDALRIRLDADLTHAHLMGLWALAYEPEVAVIRRAQQQIAQLNLPAPILLCGGSPLLAEALPAYLPEIDQFVARSFYSCAFGKSLRSAHIFAAVAQDLQQPPQQLVYISANRIARQAARSAGWRVLSALE